MFEVFEDFCNVSRLSYTFLERKQLVDYIFACCIALAPSLSLLTGSEVECLLAVSLCELASMEVESSSEYDCAWQDLTQKFGGGGGRGDVEGITDVS